MLKLARCLVVVITAGLISAVHGAVTFTGNAEAVGGSADGESPLFLKVNGKKINGTLFSNSLVRRIPIHGTVDAAGNFRALIDENGFIGRFKGNVNSTTLRGTGSLRGGGVEATSFRLQARARALRSGQADFSGTIKFIHCDQVGAAGIGYMTLELKRTRKADYWLGTIGVSKNLQTPIESEFSEERRFSVNGPDEDGLSLYHINFREYKVANPLFADFIFDEIDVGVYLVSAEGYDGNTFRDAKSKFRRYIAFQ